VKKTEKTRTHLNCATSEMQRPYASEFLRSKSSISDQGFPELMSIITSG
jgi:hypothetical protein